MTSENKFSDIKTRLFDAQMEIYFHVIYKTNQNIQVGYRSSRQNLQPKHIGTSHI